MYERKVGNKNYELKDQLGNVRVVISDIKEPSDPSNLSIFQSSISNSSDYYSYGALMLGRDYGSSTYRYGFNGKEKDDELKGNGNSYDFGARMLDTRVGRWLSIDPLAEKFPDVSPYNAMGNNPINMVDPDGKAITTLIGLKNAYDIYTILKEDGVVCALGEALTFTDADDASVLMTGMHTNGDEAGYLDYGLAAAGTFLPVIAGGVAAKFIKKIPNAKTIIQSQEALLKSKGIDPSGIAKINYKKGTKNCPLTALAMDEYLASGNAWTVDGDRLNWTEKTFREQANVKASVSGISNISMIDDVLRDGDRAIVDGIRTDPITGEKVSGHFFNVAKIEGMIIYIDAQLGRIIDQTDIAREGYSTMDLLITGKIGDKKP